MKQDSKGLQTWTIRDRTNSKSQKATERLITLMIVNNEFLEKITPLLADPSILPSSGYAQTVVHWVLNYGKKYGRAPRKGIETIFADYKDKMADDEPSIELIGGFLNRLNREYLQGEYEDVDVGFELERAEEFLQECAITENNKAVSAATKAGDVKGALEVRKAFVVPTLDNGKVDLLTTLQNHAIDSLEFANEDIPPPEYILSPWLTDGSITEIYSERGIGKTWLGLIIATVVTRGNKSSLNIGPWKAETPSGVLYVDGEMSQWDLSDRIKKLKTPLGRESDDDSRLDIVSANRMAKQDHKQIRISDPAWRDVFYDYLAERKDYQLMILDNISALCPGLDENSKQDWDPLNQWMLSLRHLGVAVIFFHHSGKKGSQRGTSSREDTVDNVLKLSRPDGYRTDQGAFFKIDFEKNRNVKPGESLTPFTLKVIDSKRGGLTWTEEINPRWQMKAQVLALVDDGKWKKKQIAKYFDVRPPRITQICTEARKKNYMEDDSDRLTRDGRHFIKDVDLEEIYGESLGEEIKKKN
jgi:putative DNA primase/helicase